MEIEFQLPVGFVDDTGGVHQRGRLRLARAIDEIEAMAHPAVATNPAFLPVAVLARVVTALGDLPAVTEEVIGDLPVRDFQLLEELYLRLNSVDDDASSAARCPHCASSLVGAAPAGD